MNIMTRKKYKSFHSLYSFKKQKISVYNNVIMLSAIIKTYFTGKIGFFTRPKGSR